ncbi:MAG: hypothetical protein A2315_02060 [Ignavibacteria bacterium RIFOXYB2_FULL_35_12]|nr:MAG: hypothetical protein A2058_05250 [Ignavibacteria bacterium GWA2_36_19]OGU50884.1 MAG: hypothetical protein A2006_12205 [Ignavibacteria bacterium GWC2_35_8]OGU59978.1 MAG: hypothetical protein A2X60_06345 [Ignavibacteria bacterium GWF2_35_20]OGU83655.1 MAG: hypothetical protein A2254_04375 [Ignavibacteria bacterium RIFOXYA2_FULL_35_9]OGU84817.1 MAG: hypothetical protein A3K31_08415 [Ignavibacteria bacterium RIFOXYA12_FULL_35_25]OGU89082.1 MAG: hypothetical protein A2492_13890 [Ignavibac
MNQNIWYFLFEIKDLLSMEIKFIRHSKFIKSLSLQSILLCTIFLFANQLNLFSQSHHFSFDHYTIANGLSNNSINAILQTRDGFIWIATKDGLNRFDGQKFFVFKHDPSLKNSIPENYVMSLLESSDETFWVGTWGGGLCKYDPIHESFIKIETNFAKDRYIQCIAEDNYKNLWFGTLTGGLFKYNPASRSIRNYSTDTGSLIRLLNNNITTLAVNPDNTLWIGSWGSGFSFIDEQKNIIKNFVRPPTNTTFSNNNIWFIEKGLGKKIIISSDFGVDLYDPEKDFYVHNLNLPGEIQSVLNSPVRQTFRDSYNRLWIGTYEYYGLYLIVKDQSGKSHTHHLIREEDDPNSLTMNRIRWIYEDRKKNLWIGTEDGLNKLSAVKPFVHFRFFPFRNTGLGGRVISGIVEGHDNILWLGLAGSGFDRIDLRKNTIKHYHHDPNNPNSLAEDDVTALFEDRFGKIWIGTRNFGLNCFNPKDESFQHFIFNPNKPESVDDNWIHKILETSDGTLLIGTNSGLKVFNRTTRSLIDFKPEVVGRNSFPQKYSANTFFEDSAGELWIGTWLDGLLRYSKKEKKFFQYIPDPTLNYSISSNKITCIVEDSKGYIWAGTHSGGINKFDKTSGKFILYSLKQGLPNDVVFGILEDEKGFLWISTLNGLSKFDPEKEKFRNYDVSDGIIHNQFNWHASLKNKTGQMYFGTINGLISFHPSSVKIDSQPPLVVLTSFKIFGKEAELPQSLSSTKEILLNYDQNFFSFEFSALDIAPSHKHQFAYLLEGLDPSWVYSGSRSAAFYTDVPPGEYKFHFKACNADGVWCSPLSLSVIITPAWWMTWWFKILVVIILLGIGYLIYLYRLKQSLAIQNIRLNIANDLHDEIGSNLSSISIDSQLLLNNSSIDETQQELASFISKTVQETVETMRDLIWFINPNNDFGKDMILKMKETAAKLLAGMNWSFKVNSEVELEELNLEIRRNIYLIYKEALNNVVRHANSQSCEIELRNLGNTFLLMIKDDGKGFDEKKVQENTGLRSIKRRAANMNAEVKIYSEIGNGTVIKLVVPFGSNK